MVDPASATKAVGVLTAPANHPTLAPRRAKDLVSVSAASVDPQIQIRGSHFGPNGDLAGDVWRRSYVATIGTSADAAQRYSNVLTMRYGGPLHGLPR